MSPDQLHFVVLKLLCSTTQYSIYSITSLLVFPVMQSCLFDIITGAAAGMNAEDSGANNPMNHLTSHPRHHHQGAPVTRVNHKVRSSLDSDTGSSEAGDALLPTSPRLPPDGHEFPDEFADSRLRALNTQNVDESGDEDSSGAEVINHASIMEEVMQVQGHNAQPISIEQKDSLKLFELADQMDALSVDDVEESPRNIDSQEENSPRPPELPHTVPPGGGYGNNQSDNVNKLLTESSSDEVQRDIEPHSRTTEIALLPGAPPPGVPSVPPPVIPLQGACVTESSEDDFLPVTNIDDLVIDEEDDEISFAYTDRKDKIIDSGYGSETLMRDNTDSRHLDEQTDPHQKGLSVVVSSSSSVTVPPLLLSPSTVSSTTSPRSLGSPDKSLSPRALSESSRSLDNISGESLRSSADKTVYSPKSSESPSTQTTVTLRRLGRSPNRKAERPQSEIISSSSSLLLSPEMAALSTSTDSLGLPQHLRSSAENLELSRRASADSLDSVSSTDSLKHRRSYAPPLKVSPTDKKPSSLLQTISDRRKSTGTRLKGLQIPSKKLSVHAFQTSELPTLASGKMTPPIGGKMTPPVLSPRGDLTKNRISPNPLSRIGLKRIEIGKSPKRSSTPDSLDLKQRWESSESLDRDAQNSPVNFEPGSGVRRPYQSPLRSSSTLVKPTIDASRPTSLFPKSSASLPRSLKLGPSPLRTSSSLLPSTSLKSGTALKARENEKENMPEQKTESSSAVTGSTVETVSRFTTAFSQKTAPIVVPKPLKTKDQSQNEVKDNVSASFDRTDGNQVSSSANHPTTSPLYADATSTISTKPHQSLPFLSTIKTPKSSAFSKPLNKSLSKDLTSSNSIDKPDVSKENEKVERENSVDAKDVEVSTLPVSTECMLSLDSMHVAQPAIGYLDNTDAPVVDNRLPALTQDCAPTVSNHEMLQSSNKPSPDKNSDTPLLDFSSIASPVLSTDTITVDTAVADLLEPTKIDDSQIIDHSVAVENMQQKSNENVDLLNMLDNDVKESLSENTNHSVNSNNSSDLLVSEVYNDAGLSADLLADIPPQLPASTMPPAVCQSESDFSFDPMLPSSDMSANLWTETTTSSSENFTNDTTEMSQPAHYVPESLLDLNPSTNDQNHVKNYLDLLGSSNLPVQSHEKMVTTTADDLSGLIMSPVISERNQSVISDTEMRSHSHPLDDLFIQNNDVKTDHVMVPEDCTELSGFDNISAGGTLIDLTLPELPMVPPPPPLSLQSSLCDVDDPAAEEPASIAEDVSEQSRKDHIEPSSYSEIQDIFSGLEEPLVSLAIPSEQLSRENTDIENLFSTLESQKHEIEDLFSALECEKNSPQENSYKTLDNSQTIDNHQSLFDDLLSTSQSKIKAEKTSDDQIVNSSLIEDFSLIFTDSIETSNSVNILPAPPISAPPPAPSDQAEFTLDLLDNHDSNLNDNQVNDCMISTDNTDLLMLSMQDSKSILPDVASKEPHENNMMIANDLVDFSNDSVPMSTTNKLHGNANDNTITTNESCAQLIEFDQNDENDLKHDESLTASVSPPGGEIDVRLSDLITAAQPSALGENDSLKPAVTPGDSNLSLAKNQVSDLVEEQLIDVSPSPQIYPGANEFEEEDAAATHSSPPDLPPAPPPPPPEESDLSSSPEMVPAVPPTLPPDGGVGVPPVLPLGGADVQSSPALPVTVPYKENDVLAEKRKPMLTIDKTHVARTTAVLKTPPPTLPRPFSKSPPRIHEVTPPKAKVPPPTKPKPKISPAIKASLSPVTATEVTLTTPPSLAKSPSPTSASARYKSFFSSEQLGIPSTKLREVQSSNGDLILSETPAKSPDASPTSPSLVAPALTAPSSEKQRTQVSIENADNEKNKSEQTEVIERHAKPSEDKLERPLPDNEDFKHRYSRLSGQYSRSALSKYSPVKSAKPEIKESQPGEL